MVLLLARLGLRPTEVIAIQIDDINWRAGEILIRGKGQMHDRMPLPQDVGKALAEYIRRDRVTTSRALFVQSAHHITVPRLEILNSILKEAFAKTGLKPPVQYVGAHVLRHSLATKPDAAGEHRFAEVGDVLRHRSMTSTMIYAKLDIEGLRSVAQPWPVKGGAK